MRDGYLARWSGHEYEAAPDGDQVRLYRDDPAVGFTELRADRFRRVVPLAEVDALEYVRTRCRWKGEPFIALAEHRGWLRLEYVGGRRPTAEALGLEEFDFGVYQGWAPATEVTDLVEERV